MNIYSSIKLIESNIFMDIYTADFRFIKLSGTQKFRLMHYHTKPSLFKTA